MGDIIFQKNHYNSSGKEIIFVNFQDNESGNSKFKKSTDLTRKLDIIPNSLKYKITDFGISFDCFRGTMVDFGMDKYLAPELFGSANSNFKVLVYNWLTFRPISENSISMPWEFH